MSDIQTIKYNPNLNRSEKTKYRLSLAGERKGHVKGVLRDGIAPTPVMTKACKMCKKPCPITNKGFVCTACVIIFY